MKHHQLKKTDPVILEAVGGMFGRTICLRFREGMLVMNHKPGTPKDKICMVHADFQPEDHHFFTVRNIFYKKYGTELVEVESICKFAGQEFSGSINKQLKLCL